MPQASPSKAECPTDMRNPTRIERLAESTAGRDIIRRYLAGDSVKSIYAAYHISSADVYCILKAKGIPLRSSYNNPNGHTRTFVMDAETEHILSLISPAKVNATICECIKLHFPSLTKRSGGR